jgi:putative acetyltransferase
VLIRREAAGDAEAIRAVTAAAFRKPGAAEPPAEATLVDELRAGDAWLPGLSLVALDVAGDVVGHVLCTRGHVADWPVLGLGPLSVRPACQRRGFGSALTRAVLGAGDALGEPLVALLGSPDYYGRFGFRPSTDYGIVAPWGVNFQVRTLSGYGGGIAGEFRYARPFELMD